MVVGDPHRNERYGHPLSGSHQGQPGQALVQVQGGVLQLDLALWKDHQLLAA